MKKFRRMFTIGDIHGDWMGYDSVITQMKKDGLDLSSDLLVFVGDLIDGFPYSEAVVDAVMYMQMTHSDNVIVLKGNHEEMMIHGVKYPRYSDEFETWWYQGGKETYESYTPEALQPTKYIILPEKLDTHIQWMESLPTLYESEDFYFVHAGLDPLMESPYSTSQFARMWIRGPFLRSDRMWDKRVVHGHSPVKLPEVLPNRININTRPRGKGYVTGAELFADSDPKLYKPDDDTIAYVNDAYHSDKK